LLEEISRQLAFGLQTLRVQTELAQHQMHLEILVQARTHEIEVLNVDLTRKKEEAEVANRAKDDFISNLSHELRTPLNAVLGLTRLLEASTLNPRQRNYLEKIQLSGTVLRTLMDDILDFSKIKAKELKLDPVPFSLDVLLTSLTSVLGVGIGHKPIEPLLDVAADVPDALIGDGFRLQQILLNLISNAVKFTHQGEIAVTVQCLAAAEWADPTQVSLQFSVRDTGIGMSDETRKLIFNGFTQADASTSRLYGGTGLGLTISAQLASLMDGQIEVISRLGQGSEFRLTVPLKLGHPAARPLQTQGAPGYRVLIVASHPLARQYLNQTGQRLGWQTTVLDSATDGLQALRLSATATPYDLLLLDWIMAKASGADLLRQAQTELGCRFPALILMAPIVDLEQVEAASAQFSPQALLAKPLMSRSLLEAAFSALAGRSVSSVEVRPSPLVSALRLNQMRLLVAEDNALNQEVIEHILTQAGAQVVLASDGRAAVAALQVPGARFDAVLMDIQMPVMDGYAATRQIREVLGLLDLPIIAMTAHARPQDHEKSRLAGMVGHLVKPLHVEDLLGILVRNAGQRRAAQQAIEAPA
jgi:signal transduction histidine kinase/DNA-binding response OmpR family regulator